LGRGTSVHTPTAPTAGAYSLGTATLVKRVDGGSNGEIFVAKKVLMGRLDDKEQEGAMLEVKLLK